MPRTTAYAFFALVLMAGLAAEARATLIVNTPAGISGGQSFIVTFVDTTIGHATDTSIADYNSLIATAASGITYSGGTIGSWQILGATAAADPAATVFSSSLPIYDDLGHLLGTSGPEWLSAGAVPQYNQTGTASEGRPTWTGLLANGNPASGDQLGGSTGNTIMGQTDPPPPGELSLGGLNTYGPQASTGFGDYYGWAVFTDTAPEPSTLTLSLMGLVGIGAVVMVRRRRAASVAA
jgi:PEP-CTERM motif